jgi:hypothetical protein
MIICPLMSHQGTMTAVDNEKALVISGLIECKKTKCAWWIENSEEYVMGGNCAIRLIGLAHPLI